MVAFTEEPLYIHLSSVLKYVVVVTEEAPFLGAFIFDVSHIILLSLLSALFTVIPPCELD